MHLAYAGPSIFYCEAEGIEITEHEKAALAYLEAEGRSQLQFHRTSSPFRNIWTTYKPFVKVPAILLALLFVLGIGGVGLDIYMLQSRIDRINAQIAEAITSTFPDVTRVSDRPLDQMKSKLMEFKKNSIDPTQSGDQVRSIDILYQISQLIPKQLDVLFNRLVVGTDGVTISGETAGFNTVDDIKNRLERSDLFKKVTIAAANMDKSGNKVRFRLKIDL